MPGVSPGGVAENGTRVWQSFFRFAFHASWSFPTLLPCLPSLAVGLVPAGHHYYEGSDFCQPLRGAFCIWQFSLLISIELPSIPSPTTLLPFRLPRFDTLPSFIHRAGCHADRPPLVDRPVRVIIGPLRVVKGSRSTRTLPDRLGRIEFTVQLRTALSPQVAPHPSSRKRSYHCWLQAGNDSLIGTSTRQFNRLHRRTSDRMHAVARANNPMNRVTTNQAWRGAGEPQTPADTTDPLAASGVSGGAFSSFERNRT